MDGDPENTAIFRRLQRPLLDVDLEVQAVLDVVSMKVGDIMGLHPGDVIQLSTAGLDEVQLWVEGKPKFLGKAAQRNGTKVFVAAQQCG
jgi:flagellar motor switch protein FliM